MSFPLRIKTERSVNIPAVELRSILQAYIQSQKLGFKIEDITFKGVDGDFVLHAVDSIVLKLVTQPVEDKSL